MNYALIAANVLVYIVLDVFARPLSRAIGEGAKDQLLLDPESLSLYQFFSYQFLHGDFWHLFGNMLFLWVFGNSVNGKMGQVAYLFFYLACGVFAGIGVVATSDNPCLGASGSIAGITTAFLVLFPRSGVTVFYWLWLYVGTIQVQAMLLILVKIILWDNILSPNIEQGPGAESVAYAAHIAGYIFGFAWCSLMLLVRALPRDQYDIVALVKRYHQRQQFRTMMADPNQRARATFGRVARPITAITGAPDDEPVVVDEITAHRADIGDLISDGNFAAAAERYESLIAKDPNQVLPRRHMLAIANHLMTVGQYAQAAAAYEKFLKQFPTDLEAQQIRLVLGILYAKYLQQYEPAQRHLRDSLSGLTQPDLVQQASHWLDTVTAALAGRGPSPA